MKVSVITITLNDPAGLAKTLGSLLPLRNGQVLGEVIVVDSSPAVNRQVIGEFSSLLPLVHVEEEKRGIYPAMNAGLEKAAFPLVWFLNGGDALDSVPTLETGLEKLEREKADAICFGAALFSEGVFRYSVMPPENFWDGICRGSRICHQAIIYRRDSFREIFPFRPDLKLAGDFELHLRAWCAGLKLLPESSVLVRFDTSGASSAYRIVLDEYRQSVDRNRSRIPGPFLRRLEKGIAKEAMRLKAVKFLAASPFSPLLRPVWNGLNRWRSR